MQKMNTIEENPSSLHSNTNTTIISTSIITFKGIVTKSYTEKYSNEISCNEGNIVDIVFYMENNIWSIVRYNNKEGFFPNDSFKIINNIDIDKDNIETDDELSDISMNNDYVNDSQDNNNKSFELNDINNELSFISDKEEE